MNPLRKEQISKNASILDIPSLAYFEKHFISTWLFMEDEKEKFKKGDSNYSLEFIEEMSEYSYSNHLICIDLIKEKQEMIFGKEPFEKVENSEPVF